MQQYILILYSKNTGDARLHFTGFDTAGYALTNRRGSIAKRMLLREITETLNTFNTDDLNSFARCEIITIEK